MDSISKIKASTIGPLMKTKVLRLNSKTNFENAVMHIGQMKDSYAVVIDDNEMVVGMLRSDEIIHALVNKAAKNSHIDEIMVKEFPNLKPETSLKDAAREMSEHKLEYAPVMKDGHFQGVLAWNDLQKNLVDEYFKIEDRSKELDNQLTYKDDYLGVVSHDIRTPLSVISLCCDYMASDSSAQRLSDEQKSFIERIRRNADNATNMVVDILDVIRLEKTFDLSYEIVDVDKFLGDVISNLQVIASDKNIEVVVECSEHLRVPMDQKRIVHVLENLVNNAVKFSPSGKRIYVSASSEQRRGETYLCFSVRDEGQGIKSEDEQRVFDEFKQLESGMAKTLGIGLGLAIAKKFVSLHRGLMEVEGGWQEGATFRALIPGAIVGKDAKDGDQRSDKIRVLVVEDDESIREYFQEELEIAGYDVYVACDGSEGIYSYFRYRPDLIFSDIRMGNVDGFELMTRVRMTDRSVPFVLCSGYYPGLAEDLAASEQKADCVLEKPVTAEQLVETITSLVKKADKAS